MKSYAKINLFLKVVGTRGNYHEIASRFVLFKGLFDELSFEKSENFKLESSTDIKDNIIIKAKNELALAGYENELNEFFSSHKIVLKKNIPMGAGLGGGSSNSAAFLNLTNETLNLKISREKLCEIGSKVGADVPFFITGYESANVSGIGEVVREFDDVSPDLKITTPDIFCDTPSVYKKFRSDFMQNINVDFANRLLGLKNLDILEYKNFDLNDLFAPCLALYPKMNDFSDKFLSGSGSALFQRA